VIYGNGRDLSQGYLFTCAQAGRGCKLYKNGKELAHNDAPGCNSGHSLHHSWPSVKAIVNGSKLSYYFDRQLVLEYDDPDPIREGKVGIWTQNNKISIARATISFSE